MHDDGRRKYAGRPVLAIATERLSSDFNSNKTNCFLARSYRSFRFSTRRSRFITVPDYARPGFYPTRIHPVPVVRYSIQGVLFPKQYLCHDRKTIPQKNEILIRFDSCFHSMTKRLSRTKKADAIPGVLRAGERWFRISDRLDICLGIPGPFRSFITSHNIYYVKSNKPAEGKIRPYISFDPVPIADCEQGCCQ